MVFKRGNLEKQVLHLPKKVHWCKRCVISNQRPRIIFNDEGICSGCINTDYKNNEVDWSIRRKELEDLLDKHRSTDGSWDVVVPSSGGKDSCFVAHQLKHEFGMNPILVTWSPIIYTDIGFKNFQNLRDAGFTVLSCYPNGKLQRKLARLSFEELGDAFHVFVVGQLFYPFHMALKMGIKLVFYGENGEAEYAGDPHFKDKPYKPLEECIKQHHKGVSIRELISYGVNNKDYITDSDFTNSDLTFYESPDLSLLNKMEIKGMHYFSYYHKWLPQENYYYAVEHTGFQPNPERTAGTYSKYASLDDKMDGFHYYLRYIKFGLGRCMEDAGHEIRDGHITREEGIALMKRYEGEFPQKYFKDFLEYLNITEEHFWGVVDSWRASHLWEKLRGEWVFKYPIS